MPIFNKRNGFKGRILGSHECLELSKPLLVDCAKIHKSQVASLKNMGHKYEMFYTQPELYEVFDSFEPVLVGNRIKIDSNLEIEYRYNSHVLGSCNLTIYIRKPNQKKFFATVYTSDMGSQVNYKLSHYLQKQDIPKKCDLFISEATYSSPNRDIDLKTAKKERKEFIKIIKEGLCNGRRILLPTFAFSRSQTLATELYLNLKDEKWFIDGGFEIIMDGTLMNNINTVYARVLEGEDKELFDNVMNWNRLKRIKEYTDSLQVLKEAKPSIIICSSGFLESGMVQVYMPHILRNSNDVIMLTGYCSQDNQGSMGWKVLNPDVKTIDFGQGVEKITVVKSAKIHQQKTWTSHISNKELKDLFASLNCGKIILHHMNEENKEEFINDCKEHMISKNKTTPIVAVGKGCFEFVL